MKKFFQWPYVKRHYGSKGIADIVAISKYLPRYSGNPLPEFLPRIAFIQCKYSSRRSAKKSMSESDKDALIKFADDCGATPVYAYSENRKIKLINLTTNRTYTP